MSLAIASLLTDLATALFGSPALLAEACYRARRTLAIIENAYNDREARLAKDVRDLAIEFGNLTSNRLNELIRRLGSVSYDFDLDVLEVLEDGRPVASVGGSSIEVPLQLSRSSSASSPSLLVRTNQGTYVQVVFMPIEGTDFQLVGGYEFADAFAYELRKRIGDLGQVIVAVQGRVSGSTLPTSRRLPRPGGTQCRTGGFPRWIKVGGVKMLVDYVPVGQLGPRGALGIALEDQMDLLAETRRVATKFPILIIAFGLGWLLLRPLIRPVRELTGIAGRIADGELDVSFGPDQRRDEIGQLSDSLERMTSALKTQAAHLRDSAKRSVAAQDAERHRLARDLHDGAQQRLVTLSLILRTAGTWLRDNPNPELEATLSEGAQELVQAQSELRELARGIHPAILTDEGLGPALESLAERSHVRATITAAPSDRLPAPVEATAYFIVSEALANVAKHAHASLVTISVSQVNGSLKVEVADDGVGGADPSKGSGLCGLTDRAAALGGWLEVDSPLGQGTRIVAQVPCGQS